MSAAEKLECLAADVQPRLAKCKDIRGQRFGQLVAVRITGRHQAKKTSKNGGTMWLCRCDCGRNHNAKYSNLTSGNTQSCGHAKREASHLKKMHPAEYVTWRRAIWKHNSHDNPLTMCSEWLNSFESFLSHVGKRPSEDHELRVFDKAIGLAPGNVRWLTQSEAPSVVGTAKTYRIRDEDMSTGLVAKRFDMPIGRVRARLEGGWSPEKTITTPYRAQPRKLPITRGECIGGPRPCPHISCRYHLAIDSVVVGRSPTVLETQGELDLSTLKESCALDVADRGQHSSEEIGDMLGLTRTRVNQIELMAIAKLRGEHKLTSKRTKKGVSVLNEFRDVPEAPMGPRLKSEVVLSAKYDRCDVGDDDRKLEGY